MTFIEWTNITKYNSRSKGVSIRDLSSLTISTLFTKNLFLINPILSTFDCRLKSFYDIRSCFYPEDLVVFLHWWVKC